ncbi:MAG: M13 family metallopeptidase [Candidatus Azobacteroides sp.]|nr:M13 family metallopeptidase [Candidatus Azobacteroides sp.]
MMSFKASDAEKGINVSNLDSSVSPGDDFYQYACGGWMKNNPLKPEYSRYGTFDQLTENNREQIRDLINDLSFKSYQTGTPEQKISDLYKIGMDSIKLNKDKTTPIQDDLAAIDALQSKEEITALIAGMHKTAYSPFFQIYVGADDMNSNMNIVQTYQGGYAMGDRDYYLLNDSAGTTIRTKYQIHVRKMFELAGFTPQAAEANANSVLKIETCLAEAAYPREILRDPLKNYHKITIDTLQKEAPEIDWKNFFSVFGLPELDDLNVSQIEPLKEVSAVIHTCTMDELKAYLKWNVLDEAASFLSDDMAAQNFDFYGKTLSGQQEIRPRWKRAVGSVEGSLGEVVGEMYVRKYFPPEAKKRMLDLVGNLKLSLQNRIKGLAWMSDSTKEQALDKLTTFRVKIGYPDKWKDYSSLEIKNDSYWANIKRARIFKVNEYVAKAGKPVDKDEWLMTPQTVNAYYNPSTNEICFPAGILQPPFFDMQAGDAVNYGAIGVVIGHEMTHGFDDQGRQYDKDGNLKDWWTATDAQKFNERADKLVEQFDNIIVLGDTHANGRFTLGENIADQGGLIVAFEAFQKAEGDKKTIDGFTPEQQFFLSYANVWAGNIRDEEILRLTKIDPHSLGRWRVDMTLKNVDPFYEAFSIKKGDAMYINPSDRVVIW